jgi:hypothetical protein
VRQILVGLLVLMTSELPLPAQKIEVETPSRERVVRIQTAINHLTVIEVTEPVTTVAVGSPQAFKVERRENKVFIQPLQENVSTNLFIWTASTRLNYELVPAIADAGQMDFAVDYPQPSAPAKVSDLKKDSGADANALPDDLLLKAKPVRLLGAAKADFTVLIRDVYKKEEAVFVRFSIENRSNRVLRTGMPNVVSLSGLRFDQSLWSLQNSQLGSAYSSRLKVEGAPTPIKITRCDPSVVEVAPGEQSIGLIRLELPAQKPSANKQPTVLQFEFPVDHSAAISATLVL